MATDKEIAEKIIQITHLLDKQLNDAHAVGVEVEMNRYLGSGKKPPYYRARVYRPQPDEVLGESPSPLAEAIGKVSEKKGL